MGSIERQEERWTAVLVGRGNGVLRYYVRDPQGRHLALVEVEDTDEGRSAVAKIVAAPDAEVRIDNLRRTLTDLRTGACQHGRCYGGDLDGNPPEACGHHEAIERALMDDDRAALEAAKRLP